MTDRTEFVPPEELRANAEASLAETNAPFAMHIDMVPTLNGNLRYALAIHGHPTQVEAVHPAVILRRIDSLIEAVSGYPTIVEGLKEHRRRVERVMDEYTFPEIARRSEVESGGGNDDGPDAA